MFEWAWDGLRNRLILPLLHTWVKTAMEVTLCVLSQSIFHTSSSKTRTMMNICGRTETCRVILWPICELIYYVNYSVRLNNLQFNLIIWTPELLVAVFNVVLISSVRIHLLEGIYGAHITFSTPRTISSTNDGTLCLLIKYISSITNCPTCCEDTLPVING
jgi:hypothetical protein